MRAQKAVGELNDESFEIEEYIRAFRSSTDRARYMVFVNTAVCVLILVCTWNMMPSSWSVNRIRFLEASERRPSGYVLVGFVHRRVHDDVR